MKKSKRALWALLALAALNAGCAGIISFSVPEEFKGKKTVEDPPLTYKAPAPQVKTA